MIARLLDLARVGPRVGPRVVSRGQQRGDTRSARPAHRAAARPFTRADLYRALRRALATSLARTDFRIVHLAPVRGRLELVVEAADTLALARGMQGFQVSAARALNRLARRRGTVFPDRYRMRILRTRLDVRALVGSLPLGQRTAAWPETWLLRIEAARSPVFRHGRGPPRLRYSNAPRSRLRAASPSVAASP